MSVNSPSISPVMFLVMPVSQPVNEVGVAELLDEVVVAVEVFKAAYPNVDVLSCGWLAGGIGIMAMKAYCDDVVLFHETWFMAGEDT